MFTMPLHRSYCTTKLQFFAFVAGVFELYFVMFQTDWPMVPFMFAQLEKIFEKLHRLIFHQESLAALSKNGYRTLKNYTCFEESCLLSNHVNIGAATKALLNDVMVSAERKFQGQCKQMVLDIHLKLSKRSPLRFAIVRCASCLSAANMAKSPNDCSQRSTIPADCLFTLKKISASVADNS